MDWVQALSAYGHSGDYGLFAPLLQQEGVSPDKANQLADAAFYERTSNPVLARQAITTALPSIQALNTPIGGLFQPELESRMQWANTQDRGGWELSLGDAYLSRGDYLRAALFMQESHITRQCNKQQRDATDFDVREAVRKEQQWANENFKQLCYLRNAMAHGVKPESQATLDALQDEPRLRETLRKIRRDLFR